MHLRNIVRKKILQVLANLSHATMKSRDTCTRTGITKFRILVLDGFTTTIVSSCLTMVDLFEVGIILCQDLYKTRRRVPHVEAVYFVTPTIKSIHHLIHSPEQPCHVLLTDELPDDLHTQLATSKLLHHIKTLKELSLAFLAIESNVFTLNYCDVLSTFCSTAVDSADRDETLHSMAQQLATVCASTCEQPALRYQARACDCKAMETFVTFLDSELKQNIQQFPITRRTGVKNRSLLIILDRAVDLVSPLTHEMTYDGLAHDLLSRSSKDGWTDENDEVGRTIRYKRVSQASSYLAEAQKTYVEKNALRSKLGAANVTALRKIMQSLPEYIEVLEQLSEHQERVDECELLKNIFALHRICQAEQEIVAGYRTGAITKHQLTQLLLDNTVRREDKLRLILIATLSNCISEEQLARLVSMSAMTEDDEALIDIISKLRDSTSFDDRHLFNNMDIKVHTESREEIDASAPGKPLLKFIADNAINNTLSEIDFPFMGKYPKHTAAMSGPLLSKYGQWSVSHDNKTQSDHMDLPAPTLFLYVIGGVSYCEIRAIYEVMSECKNSWNILLGSDSIITARDFLAQLKKIENAPFL